jgi:hypothetical protein
VKILDDWFVALNEEELVVSPTDVATLLENAESLPEGKLWSDHSLKHNRAICSVL